MSPSGHPGRALVIALLVLAGFFHGPAVGLLTAANGSASGNSESILVSMNNRPLGVSDFTMFAGPDELTSAQGSTGAVTLFLWSLNRFSSTVRLSVTPPPGMFVSLDPSQVSLIPEQPSTSALTVLPLATLLPGTYAVDVTGTSGSKSHTITVKVNVTPRTGFIFSLNPQTLQIEAGSSTTATLTLAFQNGLIAPVDLTVVAPAGITAMFNPSSLEGSGTSTLTVKTADTLAPGSYVLRVDVVQGFLTRSSMFSLTVTAPGVSRTPALYTSQAALIVGMSAAMFALIVWGLFVVPRRREKAQTKYRYETPKTTGP